MNTKRYSKIAVILHWLIAIAIFAMFGLGWFMTDLLKAAPKQSAFDLFNWGIYTWHSVEEMSPRSFYFNLHKSIGLTIAALILMRVLWRVANKPPELLASYKIWERKLAIGTHHLLYILMIALPASGVIMSVYSKYGVKWFGIPLISGLDNNPMRELYTEVHVVIGIILLVIVGVHVLGALKHKLVDNDETMKRMSL